MALVSSMPMHHFTALQGQMNQLFNHFFRGGNGEETGWGVSTWMPPVDLYEAPETFVLTAELPGVRKEDIQLEVHDRTLTLRAERQQETEVKDEHYHRRERAYGSFQRVFALPTSVDAEKVHASFKDGILELQLPKYETAKPRRIAVQS